MPKRRPNAPVDQAKGLKSAYEAAKAFRSATTLAPWWNNAYWNLAAAEHLAGQYNSAKDALRFYLLSNLTPEDRRMAQDRLYAIDADIIATASVVPNGLTGFWQKSYEMIYAGGALQKVFSAESGDNEAWQIQQTGSTYSVKCMRCTPVNPILNWAINVESSSINAITFRDHMEGSQFDDRYECRLEVDGLSCNHTRKRGNYSGPRI